MSDQECRSFRRTRAEDPFTFGSVTVAKMWSRPGGHACYVQKRDDVWVVTQERKGHVVRASNVGSAAEALRTVEEFEETFDSAARSA